MSDPVRRCGRCDTPHHPECWDYLGGCAIFGCAASSSSSPSLSSSSSSSSSPSSLPPSPVPPHILPLVTDLAGLIRLESRNTQMVASGLGVTLLVVPAVALAFTLVSEHLWGHSRDGARDLIQGTTFLAVTTVGVLGIGSVLVALLRAVQARIERRSLERELASRLGAPLRLGGDGHGRILDRLDLRPAEVGALRRGRLLLLGGVAFATVALSGTVGLDTPLRLVYDLSVANVVALTFAVGALVFALYWAAARRLVDLQVTLNRIEAAGKGKGGPAV